MKNLFLILCLLAFTGAAYAEVDYNRTTSPLSVGETDRYFKDLNSWDSRNLYVPGQSYNQQYDYSYENVNVPGQTTSTQPTTQYINRETGTTEYSSSGSTGTVADTATSSSTTQSTQTKRRGTGYRWGKNPNETHYNFGATGFKSKGFGQGYSN